METTDKNKLIVALDVETASEARHLVHSLKGIVGMFKIGSQLFTAAGPDFVREIVSSGERIFLDLKFHDIPDTVAAAGVEATRLGVSIFNIHAAGGSEMMRRTVAAVSECAASENMKRPLVIAVTVLTSADAATLAEVGYDSGRRRTGPASGPASRSKRSGRRGRFSPGGQPHSLGGEEPATSSWSLREFDLQRRLKRPETSDDSAGGDCWLVLTTSWLGDRYWKPRIQHEPRRRLSTKLAGGAAGSVAS